MRDGENKKFIPDVNLLFIDYGSSVCNISQSDATHIFWQMELIIEGSVFVVIDKKQLMLSEKQIILIPPGIKHKFIYTVPRKTWSFKFSQSPEFIDDSHVLILPDTNDASQKICDVFFELLSGYKHIPPTLYAPFEYLIGGILVMNYTKIENEQKMPKWVIQAKEFIAVNIGRNINLEDLAKHLKYTRIHLSRLCKTHLNMKLKDFFDCERANIARKKLLYSHKSISEIANETGFNDIYSFSRFYKRVTSVTPSEQRNIPNNEL